MKLGKTLSMVAAVIIAAVPASSAMANQYEDQIMYQLRNHQNQLRGYRMDDYEIGTLRPGERHTLNATLNRGDEIVITGACDVDCRDIDLIIYDDRGRELDRDTLVDDEPVLNFIAPYSGNFDIEVVMYDCSASYCYFGVALFSD